MITGPLFEEMLHPQKIAPHIRQKALAAKRDNPLDPINLFNITWRNEHDQVYHIVLPKALTGVDANIVVIYGNQFPSGSHKVGAAYSVLLEKELFGEVDPAVHTLVWPSTGNYGIGGAWVGGRMGCKSIVVLPEGMSRERFERIATYGATVNKTVGSESNVKEIYDETHRLRQDPNIRILNQFEVMGNYRFHYHVTGNTIVELAAELAAKGVGKGKISAYVSAMGSAGTIAAGDRLKQVWPDHKIVGLEPIQCPTLYNNGYGSHDIQGIGDKHVTWIHNVLNMDAMMCIDDIESKLGLQLLAEEAGRAALVKRYGLDEALVEHMSQLFGISGICNVLGAIKTAKYYGYGKDDVIVTVATDGMDRYPSVMQSMAECYGALDEAKAVGRVEGVFHGQRTDWVQAGTPEARQRWHNLKYYTWVEQQGKSVQELDAQRDPAWWENHQAMVQEIDARLTALRAQESLFA
ncbi:MAG: pyridoxal-phosphate dependent enzyme [Chloroflexi bacterium]|uniref:PLP-dependent cysteine synthase family protein n=1 Tax=Candidatus Flexifilum breve TaxID=3140694 RepID=UPI003136AC4A|nr:pyridoxal-phosphate dependent enzyme [Chloroflexota bacterium]